MDASEDSMWSFMVYGLWQSPNIITAINCGGWEGRTLAHVE